MEAGLRQRLAVNTGYVKAALRKACIAVNDGPGPILPIHPRDERQAVRLKQALLAAAIHPPYINYRGGPKDGYFRFVISSEHSPHQLNALIGVLITCVAREGIGRTT
jgi:7-keto-8-aminopelargonate synthetase-like enzyme